MNVLEVELVELNDYTRGKGLFLNEIKKRSLEFVLLVRITQHSLHNPDRIVT
ncbi:hypothetical protein NSMM_1080006 [Nitrosomonas mobilis]|uniref:Uncharacterized protein n=1 Tax=Nitrosomonas mobilis TaxID=51642 RepID=A0A1G5SAE2_9PROT|nr:hypothetical protein NSMM_1080006 [Nitrosomonas mobilis]